MNHQELIEKAGIKLCPIGIVLIEKEYPLAASRGGRNTVYHHCDVYQGRPSYASCLTVIDKVLTDPDFTLRPECRTAIEGGQCPAVNLRKAELKAGRALFFVPYEEMAAQRAVMLAAEREASVIQFRRNKVEKRFTPTRCTPIVMDADDLRTTKRKAPVAPPADDEIETNIMEQVLKKVINDHA